MEPPGLKPPMTPEGRQERENVTMYGPCVLIEARRSLRTSTRPTLDLLFLLVIRASIWAFTLKVNHAGRLISVGVLVVNDPGAGRCRAGWRARRWRSWASTSSSPSAAGPGRALHFSPQPQPFPSLKPPNKKCLRSAEKWRSVSPCRSSTSHLNLSRLCH